MKRICIIREKRLNSLCPFISGGWSLADDDDGQVQTFVIGADMLMMTVN